LQMLGQSSSHILHRVREVLLMLWITHLMDEKISTLSGWEKQKVALARAIVHKPDCIIADEPTWNLDRINSVTIANILIDLHKNGHTIVLVTHDEHLIDYIKKKHPIIFISLQ
jgi:ABC-type ATPase involved in cell division